MRNYYTSINLENNEYIGSVHNSTNNIVVYRSKPYPSQMQAMMDVNTYIHTEQPSITEQQTQTSTPQPQASQPMIRRCCGR